MTTFEIITLVFSFLALTISIVSLAIANTTAKKSNDIAMGSLELYISERITTTKDKVNDISIQFSNELSKTAKTEDERKSMILFEKILKAAIENNINAYEDACAKYIDNKVDRKRFEKNFRTEIRQLVENDALKEYFNGVTSKYKAILKVYKQWEDFER